MWQSIKNIGTLTVKEWRSVLGDPVMLVLLVVVFTVMIYNAANSGGAELRHANVGVVDWDQSALSRQLVAALPEPYFAPPIPIQYDEIDEWMDKGKVVFVLSFPPHFERDVLAGRTPEIQLLADATSITQAGIGQGYITQIFQDEMLSFLGQHDVFQQIMPTKTVVHLAFNPNSNNQWFLGAMQVTTMMTLLGLVLVGAAVIRERERGTMAHLLVMPVSSTQIVLAKILANSIVVCVAATLSIKFVVMDVLGAQLLGSLGLFFVGSLVFMFSLASLAVMLATVAPTMPQYSLLMVPLYVVTLMFSGANSPRSNMPQFAQSVSEYWTTTQFAIFSQNVLFRGAGWAMVWEQIMWMALGSVLFLGMALLRFKKMLEKQG